MTKKLKYLIGLNIVILLSFQLTYSENLIYPKKKPTLSDEKLEEKISKNIILPKVKPSLIEKKENELIQTSKIENKSKIIERY